MDCLSSCSAVFGDIGHVLALDGGDDPDHLASSRYPAFGAFPGGGFTGAAAAFVGAVVVDQDRETLDAGDEEGADVAGAEQGPRGRIRRRRKSR
jgi:hypothetical protein